MASWNDYNDAQQNPNLIPKGTLAKVRLTIRPGGFDDPAQGWTGGYATRGSTGAVYLNGEFTVLEGPYAKRKIFTLIGLYSPRAGNLLEEPPEMRRLDQVQPTAAVLGREAPGVDRLADQRAVRRRSLLACDLVRPDLGHGDDLIDDAGQLEAGLAAVDLRHEDLAVEVVEPLVEDPDEDDVATARVLQVGEPAQHLAPVQP